MKRRSLLFGVIGCILVLATAGQLSAELFENYTRGGRALGMGGAFTGLADDVYALSYNPAGLSSLGGLSVNFNYQPSFAFDDISALGVLAGYDLGFLAFGIGFNQIAQEGGLSQSQLDFGVGKELDGISIGPVSRVRIGLVVHMYLLSLDGYESDPAEGIKDSASAFGFGISTLFNLFSKNLTVGLLLNNLNSPSISFFENGTGSDIKMEGRLGLSYLVNEYFRLCLDYAFRDYPSSDSLNNLFIGSEIYFYNAVMLRFGFDEGKMAMGLGIKAPNFDFSFALRIENQVDIYYQFDLSLKLGSAGSADPADNQ